MIAFNQVSKVFGDHQALQEISFNLKQGEKCCLVGPTGSGKTTLLRLIAGLERPDWGEIFLNGSLVSSANQLVPPYLRKVDMVFQNLALWPHLTVLKHLVLVMDGPLTRRQKKSAALSILEQVGLGSLAGSFPHTLSGGQKQKLAIARMLAGEPRIALLDEPYAHLDAGSKQEMRKLVLRWCDTNHVTLILVTHDLLEDFSWFDRLALMRQGALTFLKQTGDESHLRLKLLNLLTEKG